MKTEYKIARLRIVTVVFLCSCGFFLSVLCWKTDLVQALERSARAPRSEEEQRIIDVYRKVNEAVVFITTITLTMDPFDFYSAYEPQKGTGSGIIVDAQEGIVVTNLHVIGDAHRIEVTLANGKNLQAKLVGEDPQTDTAVLKLVSVPSNLTQVTTGDSAVLEVGQRVLAIGNPFGLNRTLTEGIISSLDRVVKSPHGALLKGLIQTDAAINPGNSGGPLLDTAGRLIGVNTAILSQSGDSAGIGFATPINQIKRILPQLVSKGRVLRPLFGWVLADTSEGPMVLRVMEGGAADRAGLEGIERQVEDVFLRGYVRDFARADLITHVNGRRVKSKDQIEDLVDGIFAHEKKCTLTVRRGGRKGVERQATLVPDFH
jgi:S1-C subfamily serine protease